jgi:hypothetical protein
LQFGWFNVLATRSPLLAIWMVQRSGNTFARISKMRL